MDSTGTFRQQMAMGTFEPISVTFLLRRGIEYILQGYYAEGIALITLGSEHMASDHKHLNSILDTLTKEYAKFRRARQTLEEASACFIKAQAELQMDIVTLSTFLQTLLSSMTNENSPVPESIKHQHSVQAFTEENQADPVLCATCLGPFEVRRRGVPITLCANPNSQAILRYLVAQSDHKATTDTLMSLMWPEDDMDTALRKLQVTVSILRRSLQANDVSNVQGGYILYKQRTYQLNPSIPLRTDVDEFLTLYNVGRRLSDEGIVPYYERACNLYTRPFLTEDIYADWSFVQREHLRQIHLWMCHALAEYYLKVGAYSNATRWATTIIEENRCDETAHRLLMRIYFLEERRNDALQQYHLFEQILLKELGMRPMPETVRLYLAVKNGEIDL